MIEYKKITCSSFMNRMAESLFTLRTYSIRLTANPYSGCAHNCAWCHAQYILTWYLLKERLLAYDPALIDALEELYIKKGENRLSKMYFLYYQKPMLLH